LGVGRALAGGRHRTGRASDQAWDRRKITVRVQILLLQQLEQLVGPDPKKPEEETTKHKD
jgi:hypothetical protein